MGNDQSSQMSKPKMLDNSSYFPMAMQRVNSYNGPKRNASTTEPDENHPSLLLKTAYHGVWSMAYADGVSPIARVDQCHCLDEENNRLIIAYGCDEKGNALNDVWALDIKEMKWTNLRREAYGPRTGASSILMGRELFVFGGSRDRQYFADLHSINIDDGNIRPFDFPNCPSPRAFPIFFSCNDSFYLWGGYDGQTDDTVYRLDFHTKTWSSYPSQESGRPQAAHCFHKGKHYVYGSSKTHGLLVFDPDQNKFVGIETKGSEPPTDLMNTCLISADEFIFLVGGESTSKFMHIYALEVRRNWWFCFHIRPDGETFVVEDGIVNKMGLFMIPREFGATAVYDKAKRELISIMGSRLLTPVPVFTLAIGEALGLIHLRSDMLEIFNRDGGYQPL
ncbi:Kelch motif family protein [Trichomonas vaginalis G3]|uniref:Kelch motif family protein n=1 Tax=Trichomonas vaginalis (strain ATCC PRA-98 / G3) TaxID=412133 RepID=A2DTT7_TRIV3|nr:nitrile biosynthetic process [Trichomonas vaginalis G3]EAY16234.1 Kelch motif family protein [Trichomonas vaginalis G3]KAI5493261.1 nitrile biosynthetic process [Trichomonas vaginalis G3]|eukprot:XP_001328457.1 Kelch motif family protein [Trichomonas vaginalis G3]